MDNIYLSGLFLFDGEIEHEYYTLLENEAMVIMGDFPINRNEEDEGFTPSPLLNNPEIE